MNDDHIENDILNDENNHTVRTIDEIQSSADEIIDSIKSGTEDNTESISETVYENIDIAEDIKASVHNQIDEAKESIEERHEELLDAAEEIKESAESVLNDKLTDFDKKRDDFIEKIPDSSDGVLDISENAEDFRQENTEQKNGKDTNSDLIESVQYSSDSAEDQLEQIPVKNHAPKIPQYVPKEHIRNNPNDIDSTKIKNADMRDDYNGYPTIDDVQPAPNGVKNTVEEKSSNKTLWIVLGVLVVLCVIGCCGFSVFIGLISALGG